jgi:hypothetical protein
MSRVAGRAGIGISRASHWLVATVVVLSLAVAARAVAQGATATILGTVTDMTGGVVPGVTIEVRNVGTGAAQVVVSDAQGRYLAPDLQIGEYEVRASLSGFQSVLRNGVTATVGSRNVLDFVLTVGAAEELVTVAAQVTQVETTSAALGSLTDQRQMRELPLNGRNFQQLILLAPGVQTVNTVAPNARQGREVSFSASGARPEGQAILLDDERLENVYRRGVGTVTGTSLGVEAIAEFQTLTNTYGAQFGGNGVVVNSVSKSGTNVLHGSVYEFHRNSALDARNFFDTLVRPGATAAEPPPFRRNQFGAALGGPLKKDRLFFFGNYEGIRQALGQSRIATVPAPGSRLPTFPRSTNPVMYDAIVNTLALYPMPTTLLPGAATGQLTTVANQVASENYYFWRADYVASQKDTLFARYIYDRQRLVDPYTGNGGQLPLWGELDLLRNHFSTAQWRRVVSSNVLNTLRFSFTRPDTQVLPAFSPNPALQFFPGTERPDAAVTIAGLAGIGVSTFVPSSQLQNRLTLGDDLLLTRGAHSVRVGWSITRQQTDLFYPFRSGSAWTFQSLPNFLAGVAQTVTGTPVGSQYNPYRVFREMQITPYVQDDWTVNRRLTLNVGLRWEYVTNPTEKNGNFFNVTDFERGSEIVNVDHPNRTNPNVKNLDPRIGFAWDVSGDHRTALRGGWSAMHSPVFPGNYISHFTGTRPWDTFQQLNPTYPVPFTGANVALPSITPGWNWYNDAAPYLIQYNLNAQREIVPATVATVGYVGSRGINLLTLREMNPFLATVDADGVYHFSSTRLNPRYGTLALATQGTSSTYDSLQLMLTRAFTRNLQAQVNYTWSSCMDDGGSPLGSLNGGNSPTSWSNPYDRSVDRGPCYFNADHAFRANAIIALPFRGNPFVEGWQVTGIVTASSGLPFTISTGFDRAFVGGGGRPNYVPGCQVHVGRVEQWFDPNCFSLQPAGTLGNVGRNSVTGPGLAVVDLAVLKDTRVAEGMRAQFRAEVFNLLNRANFALPAAAIFTASGRNPTAGQITQTLTTSRQIQLGVKLIF